MPDEIAGPFLRRIDAQVAAAARLVGSVGEPLAVADAIEAVHPEEWDDARLDGLRQVALDLGHALRDLAEVVPD